MLTVDIDARSAELPRASQEEGFKARVEESRQAELKELFKFTMLKSMFGVVWEGMGYVTMMVAFSAYSYTGQALTAEVRRKTSSFNEAATARSSDHSDVANAW